MTKSYLTDLGGVPSGGRSLQVLKKASSSSFDHEWAYENNCLVVSQLSHGFSVLQGVRYSDSSSWVTALANSDQTLADATIVEVIDANTFVVAQSGFFKITHGLGTINESYFLSDVVAGALSVNQGSEYSQPLIKVLDATTIMVTMLRSSLTATGAGSGGSNSVITHRLTSVGSVLTAAVDLDTSGILILSVNAISNANVNRLIIQFNLDSGETGYFNRRSVNNGTYTNYTNLATILGSSIDTGDRAYANISISKMYDGVDTTFVAHFTYSAYDDLTSTEGVVRRIFSGDVNLTSVRIESDQTDGFSAGSCLYVK